MDRTVVAKRAGRLAKTFLIGSICNREGALYSGGQAHELGWLGWRLNLHAKGYGRPKQIDDDAE